MQQVQPFFPSEFLGTDLDQGQHGKMLLGEACLVYWFMNRYHQDHYEDLARCWPYWKGKRREKSSHSDQKGLVEKRACLFLHHPPFFSSQSFLHVQFQGSTLPQSLPRSSKKPQLPFLLNFYVACLPEDCCYACLSTEARVLGKLNHSSYLSSSLGLDHSCP